MVPLGQKTEKRPVFVVGMKKIKDPLNCIAEKSKDDSLLS